MARIFVSYRREDSAYVAAAINEKLEQKFGSDSVFFDIDTIPLGTDFRKHISDAVGKCDVLIAIIGNKWLDAADHQGKKRLDDPADTVRLEIESALQRDIPVIPVLVGEARIPSTSDLPPSLAELVFRNAAEVRPGHDLQHHLSRLVEGLEILFAREQMRRSELASKLQQTYNDDPGPHKSPDETAGTSITETRVKRGRPAPWKRWVYSAITLALSIGAGFGMGTIIFESGGGDGGAWFGAVVVWLAGLAVTIAVFKRNSGTRQ